MLPMSLLVPAIFAVGTATFCCWRITVGVVAARPVSDRLLQAAGLRGPIRAGDFGVLDGLCAAAGALPSANRGTAQIRAYYTVLCAVGRSLPILAAWSQREMTVCSRYLAARVDRCLVSNTAFSSRVF
jgi:hypothetical protein